MKGKGELITCSDENNSELFHGVLGGLGQFGIITRARIALEPAPKRGLETRSSSSLSIGAEPSQRFDYVEGFVVVDDGLINNRRSSFFSPKNPVKISSVGATGGVLYCLEMAKNYDDSAADSIDEVGGRGTLGQLSYIPASVFTTDLPYVDFLDRVHGPELQLRANGMWELPHPWLNLFLPASRIVDLDLGIRRNSTGGPILIYPNIACLVCLPCLACMHAALATLASSLMNAHG
ncbi:cytokinin dehydrogenase 5-like [Musa acuminata AAA Group]|uniref:cytokinin dehydrogenase 5-like n=1 Tax=Musa acuminata AAA Group TaxID=214697 RepID=UPI0031D21F42